MNSQKSLEMPDKEGYWLAFDKDSEVPVILEMIFENNELSNFFGIKIDKKSNIYLVPYNNKKATSLARYKSYEFIKEI